MSDSARLLSASRRARQTSSNIRSTVLFVTISTLQRAKDNEQFEVLEEKLAEATGKLLNNEVFGSLDIIPTSDIVRLKIDETSFRVEQPDNAKTGRVHAHFIFEITHTNTTPYGSASVVRDKAQPTGVSIKKFNTQVAQFYKNELGLTGVYLFTRLFKDISAARNYANK